MKLLPIILSLILASPAYAADAERGKELALRWCVACHVVDGGHPGGDAGPAFTILANRLGRTEAELRGWLSSPHPPMPDLQLSSIEIDDIIAYILSLRH